jgi:SAM-dependent methyltransferase
VRNGLYDDAEIYDILHAPGTAAEVTGLVRAAQRFVRRARPLTWLEPACGTGRYLRMLAKRGERVIGFDRSPGMLAYARERMPRPPRARLFEAEMTGFAAGLGGRRVDVAFNLINTIRHLTSDAAMVRHLREVGRVLRKGGVYLVGIGLVAYAMEFPSEDVWIGSRGRVRVNQIVQYVPPLAEGDRWERVYSHLVITRGREEEHRDSAYRLRCYSRGQWEKVIQRAGLRVEAVVDAAGRDLVVGSSGYGVWVLRAR